MSKAIENLRKAMKAIETRRHSMSKAIEKLRKAIQTIEARLLDRMPGLWFDVSHSISLAFIALIRS